MYEDMRIKYLGVNLKYSSYVTLQTFLIIAWLIASSFCFIYLKSNDIWFFKNAWWFCIIIGFLELVESFIAISKTKRDYNSKS